MPHDLLSYMGISSFGSSTDKMVDRYGEMACECADKIDEAVIAESSKNVYRGKVRMVLSELGEEHPSPEDVIEHIASKDSSVSTKNVSVMAMKTYYKVMDDFKSAEKLGQLSEMKDFSSDGYESSMEIDEWVTEKEVLRILDKMCPEEGEASTMVSAGDKAFNATKEHKALVATLYYTGLRVSEALMIEVSHLDFENKEATVFRSKKGGNKLKKDKIRMSSEFIGILKDYIDIYDITDGLLFDFTTRTAQNRISEINEAYQTIFGNFEHCENLHPHKFRHGRVTAIANASDLEAAGNFVDHESMDTTMAYKHTTTEDQEGILPEDEREESDDVKDLLEEVGADSVDELKELIN